VTWSLCCKFCCWWLVQKKAIVPSIVFLQQVLAVALEEERNKHEDKLKEAIEVVLSLLSYVVMMWSQAEREAGKEALSKALEEERHQSKTTNEDLKVWT